MEDRIEVGMQDGKHFACMEDLRNDALNEYNRDDITPEQARCALNVVRWMENLIKHHDNKYGDRKPMESRGSDLLWRAGR